MLTTTKMVHERLAWCLLYRRGPWPPRRRPPQRHVPMVGPAGSGAASVSLWLDDLGGKTPARRGQRTASKIVWRACRCVGGVVCESVLLRIEHGQDGRRLRGTSLSRNKGSRTPAAAASLSRVRVRGVAVVLPVPGRLCACLCWSKSRQYPRIQSSCWAAATREEGEASHVCFANAPFTVQLQLWGLRRRVGLLMVFMMCVCPLVDGQRGAPTASASPSIISTKNKQTPARFFPSPSPSPSPSASSSSTVKYPLPLPFPGPDVAAGVDLLALSPVDWAAEWEWVWERYGGGVALSTKSLS